MGRVFITLPTVHLDYETLLRGHVAPYKELIDMGLPTIMIARSCFPAPGVNEIPADMSRDLLQNFLRGELGFNDVITMDNMV